MSTLCCGNNADTNVPTALAVFAVIIVAMLSGFLFKLSPNTKINHNKMTLFYLSVIYVEKEAQGGN